jgi:hypothetical protein
VGFAPEASGNMEALLLCLQHVNEVSRPSGFVLAEL